MREAFPSFYRPTENDFENLWANGLIVLDTNVLLNLYRYQSSTTEALLGVIAEVSERIWVPFHVGLEFQRRRLSVISEQNKRFSEVRSLVQKSVSSLRGQIADLQLEKRHSHIDPSSFIRKLEKIQQEFLDQLSKQEETCITVNDEDEIRAELDQLLTNKLGKAPANQKQLDDIYSEGTQRYKAKRPPGYKDSQKSKNGAEQFSHKGLTYQAEFGDLIIWKQVLDHVAQNNIENIIFVTDDTKEDWWLIVEDKGSKTIGPRPELIEEICSFGHVERFHMYSTETFIKHATNHLDSEVSDDALEDIRDIAHSRLFSKQSDHTQRAYEAENAIFVWLKKRYDSVVQNYHGLTDFECNLNGQFIGVEVHAVSSTLRSHKSTLKWMRSSKSLIEEAGYDRLIFIVVTLDGAQNLDIELPDEIISEVERLGLSNKLEIVTGNLVIGTNNKPKFSNTEAIIF